MTLCNPEIKDNIIEHDIKGQKLDQNIGKVATLTDYSIMKMIQILWIDWMLKKTIRSILT